MQNNQSEAMKKFLICSIVHLILGGIGAIIFLFLFFPYVADITNLKHASQFDSFGMGISLFIMIFLFPSFLIIMTGVGLIKLKSWARQLDIFIVSPVMLILGLLLFSMIITNLNNKSFNEILMAVIAFIIYIFLPILNIWFLSSLKTKELFKQHKGRSVRRDKPV